MEQDPIYPMRINKYLAHAGHATRRGADELIKKRLVFINGKPAELGDKVWATDKVEVRFRGKPAPLSYVAYNKPKGAIVNDEGVDTREKRTKHSEEMKDVFPVGGLDRDAHGLVILTNDGRITQKLLSPEFGYEKEYVVKVAGHLRPTFKAKMEAGVLIDGEKTKKCKVKTLNENTFRIIVTEEKRHQIRRMCQALFQEVRGLERVRIINIKLGTLEAGARRAITGEELNAFLTQLQLS
jgi:23S rRNA pseudouridine2604 synthase